MTRPLSPQTRPRARTLLVVGLAVAGLALSACSSGPASGSTANNGPEASKQPTTTQTSQQPTEAPTPDPVTFAANPANGATNVKVDTLVNVKASNGTLSKVSVSAPVKDRSGKVTTSTVSGALSKDKTSWTATSRLEPGVTYTVTSTGANPEGTTATSATTFGTDNLTLAEQTFATISPMSGGTYGVGMPIVVTFDVPVTDRKTFEQHLKVVSSPAQQGTWSWYSANEVHYRPKAYWKPGTKIQVTADINGLAAGKGIYGQSLRTASYTIGRSVVTTVNLASHYATVKIDGKTARTIPVSGGKPGFTTRSGTSIISEKLSVTQMRSETIGIAKNSPQGYDLEVHWAMRITTSGEFLHAAPWNSGNMGVRNASHGCVGMNTSDAYWLFGNVKAGDPVTVTGTGRGLEKGNGWTDWDVSWSQFQKGSAL